LQDAVAAGHGGGDKQRARSSSPAICRWSGQQTPENAGLNLISTGRPGRKETIAGE
jgi:hypothetical protein